MAGKSNIQVCNEKARAVYGAQGQPPLLQQICAVHGISIRDFASIFGISKTFAAEIIGHQKFPSLELAVRICRYWEVTVEDLFGWRIDDGGERRPLLVIDPGTGKVRKLTQKEGRVTAIGLAMESSCGGGGGTV
jgi:DNA-binding XRE family transcriptional regulator